MEIMAIYKTGSSQLQTTITNGFCNFTDIHNNGENFTAPEYLEYLGPDFVCIPLEDALDQIHEAQSNMYIKPWQEITENDFEYALGVLPPEKWQTVNGVNIFRMSEYTIGNITAHYAVFDNRYFTAHRHTYQKYDKMSKEIRELINN